HFMTDELFHLIFQNKSCILWHRGNEWRVLGACGSHMSADPAIFDNALFVLGVVTSGEDGDPRNLVAVAKRGIHSERDFIGRTIWYTNMNNPRALRETVNPGPNQINFTVRRSPKLGWMYENQELRQWIILTEEKVTDVIPIKAL